MANPKMRFDLVLDLNLESESGSPAIQKAFDNVKEKIENKAKEAVKELGEMSQELMVTNIINNGNYRTGALANSIVLQFEGDLSFLVGSNLSSIVPTVIEEGRGEVYAKNARCLHYVDQGKEYFVKSVAGYEGNPYVAPTAEAIGNIAKDVILNKIYYG